MLEYPEGQALAKQLKALVLGRRVEAVLPPSKPHKFCWYTGDPAEYDARMRGATITTAEGFGMFEDIGLSNGLALALNDGVNLRYMPRDEAPKSYQLLVALEGGVALVFTVAMYGGIQLHGSDFDNPYYLGSLAAASPLSPEFEARYRERLAQAKPTLSAKAFLATEQRFPGIGNGVLQDILLAAGVHPKRKLATLTEADRDRLLQSVVEVIGRMTALGGRDTERGLLGEPGGYKTQLCKNTVACPLCGGPVTKEPYLGGSVYYCPHCQPLIK